MDFEEQKYYTVPEVAIVLRCNPNTILIAIRRGKLRAYKLGRVFRILDEDLFKYLSTQLVETSEETKRPHRIYKPRTKPRIRKPVTLK